MRGRFSIEWMAQSSQRTGPGQAESGLTGSAQCESDHWTGPAACGTHSESLPGFYCRSRIEGELDKPGPCSTTQHQYMEPLQNQNNKMAGSEVGFSSGTEEETSGYESEGGRSRTPVLTQTDHSATSPQTPPTGRRPRTAFTAEQINSLESAFKRNAYLGTQDKAELCRTLNLSDKQIRNWFQNRRMKLKRMVQDALAHACQANAASHYMQAYRTAPYPRYHAAAPLPEGPAPYVHPHSLQFGSPMPLDSFYQYSSLPGMVLPTAAPPVAGSFPTYPSYY
ncbi:ventrally expressed dharma/bozozok antagonist isoform 1-T1 [Synchiropus picturatus]